MDRAMKKSKILNKDKTDEVDKAIYKSLMAFTDAMNQIN